MLGEWALSMVGVEEGREFRFRGDLYSQESTFPLVFSCERRTLCEKVVEIIGLMLASKLVLGFD